MKSTVSIADLEAKVQSLVRPERMEHIRRVAELAREIARNNGLDTERAYLAGLLHDAARDLPEEELRRLPQFIFSRVLRFALSHPPSLA